VARGASKYNAHQVFVLGGVDVSVDVCLRLCGG